MNIIIYRFYYNISAIGIVEYMNEVIFKIFITHNIIYDDGVYGVSYSNNLNKVKIKHKMDERENAIL